MKAGISKPNRRIAVVANYGCVLLFLASFYVGKYYGWSVEVIAGAIVTAATAVITFIILHIRTRLWKLVHTKAEKLDERQIQVTRESLRYSYAIFTVVSLLVLMCIALSAGRHDSNLILVFASLLYLAHTLPSSVMAWTEKEI